MLVKKMQYYYEILYISVCLFARAREIIFFPVRIKRDCAGDERREHPSLIHLQEMQNVNNASSLSRFFCELKEITLDMLLESQICQKNSWNDKSLNYFITY